MNAAGLGSSRRGWAWRGRARQGSAGLGKLRQGSAGQVKARVVPASGPFPDNSKGRSWSERISMQPAPKHQGPLGAKGMKRVVVDIEGVSPYSQSRYYQIEKKEKESAADYEMRTWRERLHSNETGNVIIPPMSFKNCISEAAKFLSVQIPGKGKSTYTKHFEAGVLVNAPLVLPVQKDKVDGEWLFVPASGRRGDGKRVQKCFPVIPKWGGKVEFIIIDDTITKEPFEYHIQQAGQLIGIGRFRPRNNGYYGRFKLNKLTFEDYA